jgi:hypothetical protein
MMQLDPESYSPFWLQWCLYLSAWQGESIPDINSRELLSYSFVYACTSIGEGGGGRATICQFK